MPKEAKPSSARKPAAQMRRKVLLRRRVETARKKRSSAVTARASVIAQPGDTLWAIAELHHGDIPIMRYVDQLVALNGGASIVAGQPVVLP